MLGSSILSKFFFSFFVTGSHVPQVGREYSVQPRMTLNSYSACFYIWDYRCVPNPAQFVSFHPMVK